MECTADVATEIRAVDIATEMSIVDIATEMSAVEVGLVWGVQARSRPRVTVLELRWCGVCS